MFFISSKKLFVLERWIFFLPFHTFQIQKDKSKWNNLSCDEMTYKFADVIFGLTQKLSYITLQNFWELNGKK